MGQKPSGTTLERKNNNEGYCKENCAWITPQQQAQNRRVRRDRIERLEQRIKELEG